MKVLYLFQVVSVVFFISVGGFIVQCLIRDFFDLFFWLARDVLGLVDVATEKLSERNGTKTHNFPLIFRATSRILDISSLRSVSQRRTHFGNVARKKAFIPTQGALTIPVYYFINIGLSPVTYSTSVWKILTPRIRDSSSPAAPRHKIIRANTLSTG